MSVPKPGYCLSKYLVTKILDVLITVFLVSDCF